MQSLRRRPGVAHADDRHGHFAEVEVSKRDTEQPC